MDEAKPLTCEVCGNNTDWYCDRIHSGGVYFDEIVLTCRNCYATIGVTEDNGYNQDNS